MSRPRRARRWSWLLALALAAGGSLAAGWSRQMRAALEPMGDGAVRLFEVRAGESLAQVAARLEAEGLIRSGPALCWLARRERVDRALKAGSYRLTPAAAPAELLRKLVGGEVATRKITIPEGLRLEEVAERVEQAGFGSRREFLRLARDEASGFGLAGLPDGATLEGYLFPETYLLPLDAGPRELIEAMVARFVAVWRGLPTDGAPHPRHQTVIIASLVEREVKRDDERAKVAGVIENRLADGQRLEFCSTVIYALGEPRERLLYRDLQVRSPYNTYLHGGLPPGPICSPGRASLAAAVAPAEHDYYFFVLGEDGRHIFSRTGAEHARAKAGSRG